MKWSSHDQNFNSCAAQSNSPITIPEPKTRNDRSFTAKNGFADGPYYISSLPVPGPVTVTVCVRRPVPLEIEATNFPSWGLKRTGLVKAKEKNSFIVEEEIGLAHEKVSTKRRYGI